jgi:hypothetical protein
MQIKKSTISTIEKQKKWAMRFVFVFLVAYITEYLFDTSSGEYYAGHHSIIFNPIGTAGGDQTRAINLTIIAHVVIISAFVVSHFWEYFWVTVSHYWEYFWVMISGFIVSHVAWKGCGFGSGEGCQCPKYSSYWSLLNWDVSAWDIGEDYEMDHKVKAEAVEVSGATGPNAAHINGVYQPVAEEGVGGKPVYKKDGADIWIEYWPGKEQWQLKPASSKGSDAAYMHSLGTQKEAGMVEEVTDGKPIKWTVYDSTKNVWSEQDGTKVKVKRLSGEAPVYVLRMLLRLLWRLSKSGMRIDAPRILVASVYWVSRLSSAYLFVRPHM